MLCSACSLNRVPSGHSQSHGTDASGIEGGAGQQGGAGTFGNPGTGVSNGEVDAGVVSTAGTHAGLAGQGSIDPMAAVSCGSSTSKSGMCKPSSEGIFALKSELDVWWKDEINAPTQPLVDPGRGKITIYFMATIDDVCEDGSDGRATLRTCGARLPPFYVDAVCRVIQIEFPDAMWEASSMPTYTTKSTRTGFGLGDILRVAQVTGLLGIELPTWDAPWPAPSQTPTFGCPSGVGESCFPDQDDDGHPGVTVRMLATGKISAPPYVCGLGTEWQRSSAPLSIGDAAFGSAGADTAYIGLRMGLGAEAKLALECGKGAGPGASSATIPSRVIDCVVEGGAPCTAANAQFVDNNTPNYHLLQKDEAPPAAPVWQHVRENNSNPFVPKVTLDRSKSVGPKTSMVRLGELGDDVNCADIRAAEFPAFD